MNPARAKSLLAQLTYGEVPMSFRRPCDSATKPVDVHGLTEAEDLFVKDVWDGMPGDTRWIDALRRVADGKIAAVAIGNRVRCRPQLRPEAGFTLTGTVETITAGDVAVLIGVRLSNGNYLVFSTANVKAAS